MSENFEGKIYIATRVVPKEGQHDGEGEWRTDVTLQLRRDGKLDVTHSGRTKTVDGDEKDNWLRRSGLDNNLQPIKKICQKE